MRVLLDTHAFLWLNSDDPRLSTRARQLVSDVNNDRFVSLASCWEIAIKVSLQRLEIDIPLDQLFQEKIEDNGLTLLAIERRHLLELPHLAHVHKDPFDRLLVAQAKVEGLTMVSNDRSLDAYGVSRVW